VSGTLVFKKILKFLLLTVKNFIVEPDISFNFKLFPRIVNINHSLLFNPHLLRENDGVS